MSQAVQLQLNGQRVSDNNPLPVQIVFGDAEWDGHASAANQLTEIAATQEVRDRLPVEITPGLFPVDGLALAGLTWHLSASTTATPPVAISSTVRRVSVDARVDCWVRFGGTAAAVLAGSSGPSFPMAAGAIKDFDIPANTTVSVVRAGSVDGSVFVTELI